jgi:hypothetical protein
MSQYKNIFKEVKAQCNDCGEIVKSKSDKEWTICPCGNTKIMGLTFKRISGKNYKDLSVIDFTGVEGKE